MTTETQNLDLPPQLPSVAILRLEPGDVLVVRLRRNLSQEGYKRMTERLQAVFPGHRAVILEDDATLEIARSPFPDAPRAPEHLSDALKAYDLRTWLDMARKIVEAKNRCRPDDDTAPRRAVSIEDVLIVAVQQGLEEAYRHTC